MKLVVEKWQWGLGTASIGLRDCSHDLPFDEVCKAAGVPPWDEELELRELAHDWQYYLAGTPVLTGLTTEGHPFWMVQAELNQETIGQLLGREFTFLEELRRCLALYDWEGTWYPVLVETEAGVKIVAVGCDDDPPRVPEGCEEIAAAAGVDLEGRLRLLRRCFDPSEPPLFAFAKEGGETVFRRRVR